MGSTIAIIGFTIGPDLCSMQLLNHAIKNQTYGIFLLLLLGIGALAIYTA